MNREELLRSARIYWFYFKQYWKTRLIYSTDFLLGMFSQLLNLGSSLAFLTLIFTQVENLQGWTFNEMLLLAGVGGVIMNLHHVFMGHITRLGDNFVVTGDLDRLKVRPLSVLFQVYASEVSDDNAPKLIANVALVAYAWTQIGLTLKPIHVLYAVPAVVSGLMIFGAAYLSVSTLAFWMARSRPLSWILYQTSDFRRYPFSIYSRPIKILLMTAFPIAFASFFPTAFFLGLEQWKAFQYLSLIAGPIAYYIAYRFWRLGLAKYSSTGS